MGNNYQARFYTEMGFRLKKIRQERHVSQDDLARSLGIVKQTIQKYESGEVKIPPDILHQCARLFRVSVGYFYGEEPIKIGNQKISLLIASEVSKLPSNDVKKSLYHLVCNINRIKK